MSDHANADPGVLAGFLNWFRRRVMREVDEELSTCEFECRKPECTQGEWSTCPRRLAGMAGHGRPHDAAKGDELPP